MAGTPTTNYKIPTYADTDAPDLSGAYNDAMDIIDTQLKANADAIKSASTGNYEGTAPIVVNNEERTVGVAAAAVGADGTGSASGVVAVTGKASAIGSGVALDSVVVPNARAVADYVAAHGGTAYTAGNGILISGTSIYTKNVNDVSSNGGSDSIAEGGTIDPSWRGTAVGMVSKGSDIDRLAALNDAQHGWPGSMVPSLTALKQYVESKMAAAGAAYTGTAPIAVNAVSRTISINGASIISTNTADAFVSAMKGNQNAYLNYGGSSLPVVDQAAALKTITDAHKVENNWPAARVVPTVSAARNLAYESVQAMLTTSNMSQTAATTPLTTEMLANLYVTPSGMVVYKAPIA